MNKSEIAETHPRKVTHRSALRNAAIEFVAVFLSELCWNFFRKTGGSILDFFGRRRDCYIALLL
jgi:hypothetical protein